LKKPKLISKVTISVKSIYEKLNGKFTPKSMPPIKWNGDPKKLKPSLKVRIMPPIKQNGIPKS
jgi:hypothetical protein